jgi:RHS repeat-associated protein
MLMCGAFAPRPARAENIDATASQAGGFDASLATAAATGTIKGGASALTVDTASGALQTRISFDTPRARGDAQPHLAFEYSSAAAWGVGGRGWDLAVGSIERRPRSGRPLYQDPAQGQLLNPNQEQFAFNGRALAPVGFISDAQEEGIPSLATGGGWTYFRLLNDDFTRFFWSPDHLTWVIQFKSGETWEMGAPLGTTVSAPGSTIASIDYDTQDEPGKPAMAPFRWNLALRYDAHGGGYAHPLNRIVYQWARLDSTLANLGYLVDVYDTPNVASADSRSTDPSIFAHHVHLTYATLPGRPGYPLTPVWRARPNQVVSGVDVSTAEDQDPRRSQLRRYTLRYTADVNNPSVYYLTNVLKEGRCATRKYELNGVLPPSPLCPAQPTMTLSYTGQDKLNVATLTTKSIAMPAGATGVPLFDNRSVVSPYLYDVNSDGVVDVVYGDQVTDLFDAATHQWVSTNQTSFEAVDNFAAPMTAAVDTKNFPGATLPPRSGHKSAIVYAPGDFLAKDTLQTLLTDANPNARIDDYTAINTFEHLAYPTSTVQGSSRTWHWTPTSFPLLPLDGTVLTSHVNDYEEYQEGRAPPDGVEMESERIFAVADFDADGYEDVLTATDVNWFGWAKGYRPSIPANAHDMFAKVYHRRFGSFLALRSTQKTPDGNVLIFSNQSNDRGVDHTLRALASQPGLQLPGTKPTNAFVGRLDANNLRPNQPDPFAGWQPPDPPAYPPQDASLMYEGAFFVDMNGDSLPDWVTIPPTFSNQAVLYYWPGHGDGTFGDCPASPWGKGNCSVQYDGSNAVRMLLPQPDPSATVHPGSGDPPLDPQRFVHDVTGDGLPDLITLEPTGVNVYQNRDGKSFSLTKLLSIVPSGPILEKYDVVDRICPKHVCRSYDIQKHPLTRLAFGDFTGVGHDQIVVMTPVKDGAYHVAVTTIDATKPTPGLLATIKNGYGVTSNATYESTKAHQDRLGTGAFGLPFGAWTRTMPFIRTVVSDVVTTNTMRGALEETHHTSYFYHDPVYDGEEHLFRGFQQVARVDRDDAVSNGGVVTATSFFTGLCSADEAPGFACPAHTVARPYDILRGLPYLTETYAFNGTSALSTVITTYEVRETQMQFLDDQGRRSRYAVPVRKETLLYPGTQALGSTNTSRIVAQFNLNRPPKTGMLSRPTPTRAARSGVYARLIARSDFDVYGNLVETWDDGEEGKDEVVHATKRWTRFGEWTWRLQSKHVDPSALAAGQFGDRALDETYGYDSDGDATTVMSPLVGTIALPRHHATGLPIAAAPTNASVDAAQILVRFTTFDPYGNPLKNMAGNGQGCTLTQYDNAFNLFTKNRTAYSGLACTGTAYVQSEKFDWGAQQASVVVSASGAVVTKTFDDRGRVSTVSAPDPLTGAPLAPSTTITYGDTQDDPLHSVHSVTSDGAGRSETWVYVSSMGRALLRLDPSDAAKDPKPWIASGAVHRDKNGRVVQAFDPYFYGTAGSSPLPIGATDYASLGPVAMAISYDPYGRKLASTGRDGTANGKVEYGALSITTYDAEQLRGQHQGAFTTATRDGHGHQTALVQTFHDDTQALQTVTTTIAYSSRGQPRGVAKVGSNAPTVGLAHLLAYDSLGRLVQNKEVNTFDHADAKGVSWTYAYDDNGNLVGTADSRGCGENLYYDPMGRAVAEDYSPCLATQPAYTKPNLTTGDGTEAFYQYDVSAGQVAPPGGALTWIGHLSQVSDRASRTRFTYDMRGRLTKEERQVAGPDSVVAALASRYAPTRSTKLFEYDVRDRATSETTGADVTQLLPAGTMGSRTDVTYSTRGTPARITSTHVAAPLIAGETFDADGFTRSIAYGDLAGTTATMTPDAVLRTVGTVAIARTAPAAWAKAAKPYSAPGASVTAQTALENLTVFYDLVGNPRLERDDRNAAEWPDGAKPVTKTLTYDDLYRLTKSTSTYATTAMTDSQVSPFAAELASSDGRVLIPHAQKNRQLTESFTYDALGNTTSWTDDANAFFDRSLGTITNGGSGLGPAQLVHSAGTNGESLDASYDMAGNLTLLTVAQDCPGGIGDACQHRFEYQWDEVGSLSRAKRWDMPSIGVASDPPPDCSGIICRPQASALRAQSKAVNIVNPPPPPPPAPPRINPRDIPSGEPQADLTFAYDATGGRVLKSSHTGGTVDGTTVTIFPSLRLEHADWKNGDYERTATNEAVYLTLGGASYGRLVYSTSDPVLQQSGTTHVFLEIGDPLGSTSIVVDHSTGELVERATYSSYGAADSDYRPERWGSFREAYRFTGQEDDAEVGLAYFGARYYAPRLGRFISADPLTIHALGADHNPYAYVSGRVSTTTDPSGLDGVSNDSVYRSNPPPNSPEFEPIGEDGWSYKDGEGTIQFGNYPRPGVPVDFDDSDVAQTKGEGRGQCEAMSCHNHEGVDPRYAAENRAFARDALIFMISVPANLLGPENTANAVAPGQKGYPSTSNADMAKWAAATVVLGAAIKFAPMLGDAFAPSAADMADGTFTPLFDGYPGGPRPPGPVRLISDAEQELARKSADSANASLRRAARTELKGYQIHEVHPVKFGGSPTSIQNKVFLTQPMHSQYTTWWNALQAWAEEN